MKNFSLDLQYILVKGWVEESYIKRMLPKWIGEPYIPSLPCPSIMEGISNLETKNE